MAIPLPGPYTSVWVLAVVLFFAEILLALSYDEEDSWSNFFLIGLMYFSYCQLWLFVVARAFYLGLVMKEKRTWVKTVRSGPNPEGKTSEELTNRWRCTGAPVTLMGCLRALPGRLHCSGAFREAG